MLVRELLEMKQVLISRPMTQHQQHPSKAKESEASKRTISSLLKEMILQRNSKHLKLVTDKRRKQSNQESGTKRYFNTQGREISFDKDMPPPLSLENSFEGGSVDSKDEGFTIEPE